MERETPRSRALKGEPFRVKLPDGWFRDNEPGDRVPEEGASYGLPPINPVSK